MFTAIKSGFVVIGKNILPGIGLGLGVLIASGTLDGATKVLGSVSNSLNNRLSANKAKKKAVIEIKVEEQQSATAS